MEEPTIPEPPPVPQTEPQSFGKSNRSWTTAADLDSMGSSRRSIGRASISSGSDRPKSQAGEAAETAKAGSSGFSKLLNARRKRKKEKEQKQTEELSPALVSENDQDQQESRSNESRGESSSGNDNLSPPGEVINLLTDDSEPDRTPPLTTRNSHTGFYTSSSPLIKTTSVDPNDTDEMQADVESTVSGPSATTSETFLEELSRPATSSGPMLSIPEERSSKKRSVSPGRRLKNAFSSNSNKKDSDRDRASSTSGESKKSGSLLSRRSSLSSKQSQTMAIEPPSAPLPILTDLKEDKPLRISDGPNPPRTPPHTALPAPETTVTPPTPTNSRSEFPKFPSPDVTESPESIKSKDLPSGVIVSTSGNMISHRRVRSASSASHKPSKLSNSISALTPTAEEPKASSRSPSSNQQTGFFSSVFSAAQNAASTLSSSLNPQAKARTVAQPEPAGSDESQTNDTTEGEKENERPAGERKPSAIDTLGSGDLNFSHLDIDAPSGDSVSTSDGVVITKPDRAPEKRAAYQKDEEAARLEDQHAARAVYMAYEKPSEQSSTHLPEEGLELQSTNSLSRTDAGGDQTTPSGSIFEGEIGARPYRSGSVRSRLAQRRHRGSSGATASTVGVVGASAIALGVPGANASVPRLTGFAVASKKRNRDFHQLFRSVPEDDYLIEDYSCALQREIILAGRIYISEGHICFSSNILGWVTTLVISFDEIVAIEKESTAMVFPNAIAIQTLHARHTFRSLLSRESTYDLMVNIWKINHPALKSSVNGTRVANGTGDKTEKAGESEVESDDGDEEDEIYDEDEEGDNAESVFGPEGASANGSERSLPTKGLSRQASGLLQNGNGTATTATPNANGESKSAKPSPGGDADADFPGPATHPPTEYTEPNGQYDKVIKEEIIPAPLGKVYSYVFGPASGSFIPKFMVENQKAGELQFESDKKGLTNDSKTRKYSYIKPLNGSIGPKQTKCISTETLDFLDLEKAVLVTLSTQTPDVPSGNVFCTKTKYLFTWAPGNQTRFFMTCTIEWSGKSWLKGPIEKGAIDGQTTFGNELVAALKAAVAPRARGAGATKAGGKNGKRKKTDTGAEETAAVASNASQDANVSQAKSWGFLEPVHGLLEPVVDILKPVLSGNVAVLVIGILLFMVLFRSPSQSSRASHDIGCPGYSLPQRLAAYEEMWRREESELWSWLEDRVGMDGMTFPAASRPADSQLRQGSSQLQDKLRNERMSDREMNHAIRTTRERLDVLEEILSRRNSQKTTDDEALHREL
ncbi:hypothetical protein CNMCM5793_003096 [Aspergillus hiratsukae]|uniref:VASt domain-containing protein n=1 Tax=Aspergillus hiratsukae TaxID=1194566 RepID=A0A8H6Q9A9_9EURO|nr:hypothetical protein CNMCM5793_003096 [Aspergillus hiratsukae]KAF7168184.1 hypothetical protein CNMCM6106_003474 [Aspergillus hiratsukae]